MRVAHLVFGLLGLAPVGCSLLDSVSGYAGPPLPSHDASIGGTGGKEAGTGGKPDGGGSGGTAGAGGCANDSECSDHDACNGKETCGPGGKCQKGTAPSTDDGNSCTTDSCDPDAGVEHVMGSFPTQTQCLASAGEDCAADWYRSSYVCCLTQCGDCPFGVNGVTCDRACATEIQICCGIDTTKCDTLACPVGYTKGATVSSDCTCGVAGYAVVCQR